MNRQHKEEMHISEVKMKKLIHEQINDLIQKYKEKMDLLEKNQFELMKRLDNLEKTISDEKNENLQKELEQLKNKSNMKEKEVKDEDEDENNKKESEDTNSDDNER